MTTEAPKCPECEKLEKIKERSEELGLFLDWLFSNYGTLCKWKEKKVEIIKDGSCLVQTEGYYPINKGIDSILSDYFKIDMKKVNEEKDSILEWIRTQKI